MSASVKGRRPSRTRVVHYGWRAPDDVEGDMFDESAMDRLLYAARADGIVTMHDAGRGRIVWFEGPPGSALRALKARVEAMLPAWAVRM